jgi:hypothetical protein
MEGGRIEVPAKWAIESRCRDCCFEIKPKLIKSVGQLLRQLKTYKGKYGAAYRSARWFVVAPPNPQVQEVLNREGFEYINLPSILPV